MKVKIPITIVWNDARQQWDVKFLNSHLQEFNEADENIDFFECSTVKSLVKKLDLSRETDNKLILELKRI